MQTKTHQHPLPLRTEKVEFAPEGTFRLIYNKPHRKPFFKENQCKLLVGFTIMLVILSVLEIIKLICFESSL